MPKIALLTIGFFSDWYFNFTKDSITRQKMSSKPFDIPYPNISTTDQRQGRGRVSIRISRFCVVVDRVFSHNKKGGSAGTSVGWWWRRTTQKLSRGDDLIDCKLSPSQQLDLTAAESEQCIDGIKSLSMETSWAFKKITRAATSSTKFMTRGYILNNSNYYFRSE